VIHNGIPDLGAGHHFGPSSSDAATEQSSRVVQFVLIGRIMPEKGQWYVLDALALLGPEVRARMHVVFYGGPAPGREKLVDDLLERIGALGLSGAVELRGFTQDVAKVLRECHVALVPSLMRDPFPTTVLEAMSSGKFVITTDHGGAAEVVEHLSTGYLVPPGDARALADAFLFSLAEPTKRIAIGARARESYLSGFTFDTFKERFRGVLWPAVGAHVPGTGVKP
jgi:glycosyltransferase involved in cell wall biosynthesis